MAIEPYLKSQQSVPAKLPQTSPPLNSSCDSASDNQKLGPNRLNRSASNARVGEKRMEELEDRNVGTEVDAAAVWNNSVAPPPQLYETTKTVRLSKIVMPRPTACSHGEAVSST